MKYPNNPSYNDDDYEGCVTAGRATGRPIPPPSEEDLRRAEEAWNDPAFYEFVKDDVGSVTAGYVPKPIDPSRPLLPATVEIARLPRWARVAFAARCARRVLPIVSKLWPDIPAGVLQSLGTAIRIAEKIAASGQRDDDASYAAHDAARDASVRCQYPEGIRQRSTAEAVACSAKAARSAIASATVADAIHSHEAADATVESMYRVITVGTVETITRPARDFERLVRLAEHQKWTDDTPVPPSVFGPMWEGTPPAWWTDDVLAGLPAEPAPTAGGRQDETAPASGAVPHV